ncbi:MAG: DNA polymerase III subunit gamma/tau, partial [Caulobacteraceae bacterium]|nr:DNA polymerase III subunit gamma/tau [Caulobacteraceae bacterium]
YAADLPGPEEALKALRDGAPIGGGPGGGGPGGGGPAGGQGGGAAFGGGATATARQLALQAAPQGAPRLQSFEDVVALIDAKRDISLKLDVQRFVRPINFRPGAITFEPAPGAPANLAGRLVRALKEWTGQPWLVAAEGSGGAETAWEREKREQQEFRRQIESEDFVRQVMQAFPGAEIVEVRQLAPPETAAAEEAVPAPEDDDD